MQGVLQLRRQLVEYIDTLMLEGYLNEQFRQLQQLQDESSPNFVEEVVTVYFEDSKRLLNELAKALNQQSVDFRRIDSYVHQLKGSSSSIGAEKVQNACIAFRNSCDEQNVEGCLKCLQQIKHEYSIIKTKFDNIFKLEQQLLAAREALGMPESACRRALIMSIFYFCVQEL